jgi:TolB-like protein/class 3 adenylate cyclase
MSTEGSKRKLSGILSADVKEYSRLMSQDERGTIRTLTTYKETMSALIQEYKGRVVDSPGDNLLAEFSSVVDVVNCAVEIQRDLAERNADLPPARQMEFRIGINLGDVVEEEGRIYGDGVNIAARVEGLAEGGGICISGTAYDQVVNKLGIEYEFLGEQEVKNIERPVRVYRVLSFPGAAAHRVVKAKKALRRTRRNTIIVIAAILVVGAAVAIWKFYLRPPPMEVASADRMAFPLPDKPSIAVLPFVNMSDDPGQEYFSDGLTEEIIAGLSKVPKLFVIARNSTFTYKGKPVKVQQVGEELGVRYVLEGSVQRAGDRVRITAQFIDATTGSHLWAERYDRDVEDIFALQDEITMKIMTALQVKLTRGEQARLYGKGTNNLEAYIKLLQGREYIDHHNQEDNAMARHIIEEAIALDPNYAEAYVALAVTHFADIMIGSSKSPGESLTRAIELAQKGIALDDSDAGPHGLLSILLSTKREHEKAIAEGELAVALNPNSADAHARLGLTLVYSGMPEEAITSFKKAIRLNPIPPVWYLFGIGMAYGMTGHYEGGIQACRKAVRREPNNLFAWLFLTANYSLSARKEEAQAAAKEVLRIHPKFSLSYIAKTWPFKNHADTELYVDALHKAGLK